MLPLETCPVILKKLLSISTQSPKSGTIIFQTGKLVTDIEIVSRGCFFGGDGAGDNPAGEIKRQVAAELNKLPEGKYTIAALKTSIQRTVKHYFRVTYKRNPVVLPLILEI